MLHKKSINKRAYFLISAVLLCSLTGNAWAQADGSSAREVSKSNEKSQDSNSGIYEERFVSQGDLSLGGIFTGVKSGRKYLSGPGLRLSFSKDVGETLGIGLTFFQSYSIADRFAAFMTGISIDASWTLLGNARRKGTRILMDNRSQVVEIRDTVQGSILLTGHFQQAFINSVNKVYPYSGPAVGIVGTIPSSESSFISLGVKIGVLNNGVTTLINQELSASWGIFF